jgi:hypothetical protein
MFDSNDFSDLDRAPSEWVALGGEAVAPFYREGLWIWRKCKVRGEVLLGGLGLRTDREGGLVRGARIG